MTQSIPTHRIKLIQIVLIFTYIVYPLLVCIPISLAVDTNALSLPVKVDANLSADQLLDPMNSVWNSIQETRLHINRTPPLYDGDPLDDGVRPTVTVRLIRIVNDQVIVRAHWSDPTVDQISASVKYANGGGESHIYQSHTGSTNLFNDSFCAMIPVQRGPAKQFPSMMMGDKSQPVELYFWRAGTDLEVISGHGRSTTQTTKATTPHRVIRDGDGWTITLMIPHLTAKTPLCIAIWDGFYKHRDGLKYYSLWYEVD
jgi:hypothetical protein